MEEGTNKIAISCDDILTLSQQLSDRDVKYARLEMKYEMALEEIRAANPALGPKELFRSGMNVGRDMVGTMTNTLILAFLGSGFTMILYLSSLGLTFWQLFTSAWVSVELVSGVSASVGMILAIPLTAAISAGMMNKKTEMRKEKCRTGSARTRP